MVSPYIHKDSDNIVFFCSVQLWVSCTERPAKTSNDRSLNYMATAMSEEANSREKRNDGSKEGDGSAGGADGASGNVPGSAVVVGKPQRARPPACRENAPPRPSSLPSPSSAGGTAAVTGRRDERPLPSCPSSPAPLRLLELRRLHRWTGSSPLPGMAFFASVL